MSAAWTDDRIAQLKDLWTAGYSASQIARALGGVTRNAVIGIVHRRGLAGRSTPPRKTSTARIATKIFAPPPEPPIAPVAEPNPITLESGARCTIATVCDGQCRWPHGDPQERSFHLCGNATLHGSVYCLAHSRMAYSAGNPRPKRDDATEELAVIARAERTFA